MEVVYKIINFNQDMAQITIVVDEFESPFTIDLPIDDEGYLPEGDALDYYIRGFIPAWEIERRRKIKDIKNIESISKLVQQIDEDLLELSEESQDSDESSDELSESSNESS
jgi:hypothetical protein